MLVEFRVKNFRSFKEEQVFSLVATNSDHGLPSNVIEVSPKLLGKNNLLRSAVLYGANAHGKSNLVKGLRFMETLVRKSASSEPEGESGQALHQPFRLDKATSSAPSEFEIIFIHENTRFQYGFSVGRRRVHKEWLYAYPEGREQLWFERTLQDLHKDEYAWKYGARFTGERKHLESVTRPDVLYLSVGATFNHRQLATVYEWFNRRLHIIDTTRNDIDEWLNFTVRHTLENQTFREQVRALLCHADVGITDFKVTSHKGLPPIFAELPIELREQVMAQMAQMADETGKEITYENLELSHIGKNGELVTFLPEDESNGTMRLFALAGGITLLLEKENVLVIDEMDASLHPLLVQEIVKLFNDPGTNRYGSQLIFNTHDTTLMDLDLLRRDQIWFVEKDREGESHLYPLLDYKPRNDAVLSKNYLQGRYGAIPFVGGISEGLLNHVEETDPC